MAIKPDTTGNPLYFCTRLSKLMVRSGYKNANDLARALYQRGLVNVRSRPKEYTSEDEIKKNTIGSIVKKVRKHMSARTACDVQGEYIHAYCKLFGCSADYLLGRSDVLSLHPSVQEICKLTNLTEETVDIIIDPELNYNLAMMISFMIQDRTMAVSFADVWPDLLICSMSYIRLNGYLRYLDSVLEGYSGESTVGLRFLKQYRVDLNDAIMSVNDKRDSKMFKLSNTIVKSYEESFNRINEAEISRAIPSYPYGRFKEAIKIDSDDEIEPLRTELEQLLNR